MFLCVFQSQIVEQKPKEKCLLQVSDSRIVHEQAPLKFPSPTTRVSTEVTFWHSAEYGSDFRLNSAEFRGISRNFAGIEQKSLQ
jgi:hypothetical protein